MFENAIKNRYDFVIYYDVENGNPNGDPDAGNMPRMDPETGHGIVTDVCIKRKIRNYVMVSRDLSQGYDIYVRQDMTLNAQDQVGMNVAKSQNDKSAKGAMFRDAMCAAFYDVRTFGAVMTSAVKDKTLSNVAGQVRGPVQLAFGRSVDPIVPMEVTITRMAVTTEEDAKEKDNTMGNKHVIPYALYRQEGFISANLASRVTGFSEDDLALLWESIERMFEVDRSAVRGVMTLRELIIFKHDSELGNAASHSLFDLVHAERCDGVKVSRAYSDYRVWVDDGAVPDGVTILRR